MRQKRSLGHASYSPGLAQSLDIFEPAKWRAFDPGNAQSGVILQDCVASATGFGDASGHRQVRHQYSLCARKIRLALDGARGPGQTFFMPPGKEMSVGHPGLVQERVGIDRTQTNSCRELLDRRVVIAEIKLRPACPNARHYQIGIECDGPCGKSGPGLRLFEQVGIHLCCVRKHQRIVLVELHRSFGQLPAFSPFLCRVLDPSEPFLQAENVGCRSVGDGKCGIERDGEFCQPESFTATSRVHR